MDNNIKIPMEIKVGVYYYIDENGMVHFDTDEMTNEFETKLKELENGHSKEEQFMWFV